MNQHRRRKCLHCRELFRPDPRNRHHQRYCAKPACRQASKAASQRRWLAKPENQDYFRGPANVERVRAWRAEHPGYWRRPGVQMRSALQDDSSVQPIEIHQESATLTKTALQDLFEAQPVVLIGLIANLMGSPLQEDIARTARRLRELGQDIVAGTHAAGGRDEKTPVASRPGAPGPPAVQLGGPASGA